MTYSFQALFSAAILTAPVPLTPMAFRFLEPSTPPMPPAEWEKLFITTAVADQVLAGLADRGHLGVRAHLLA